MGKNSILTIAIQLVKQGNGDQATIKALAQLRSGWSQAMGVMAAVAGVGVTLNKVTRRLQAYSWITRVRSWRPPAPRA